jgi:hypothetical protein
VRVPIPVVLLLVLAVVGGVWWFNTRHMDFLTPPSAARLEEIRISVESSLPRGDEKADAVSAPVVVQEPESAPAVETKPAIDLGDLSVPPTLASYKDFAPQGPAHMIEVAKALEEKGEFQRALFAWERVIDLTQADEAQAAMAISSIKRLRPTLPDWNVNEATMTSITLHAGTGTKLAKALTPVLESVARDLEKASSGTIKVKAVVTAGKSSTLAKGPSPVAIWLAGPDKKSASTDVLSFTVDSPDALRETTLKNVFQLVRSQLARSGTYIPPAALADKENPLDALNSRITRLCWSEFAASLIVVPNTVPNANR